MKLKLFIISIIACHFLKAQDQKYIDSVSNLTKSKIDTVRFWSYSELAWILGYSEKDKAIDYANKLILETQNTNYSKWLAQGYNDLAILTYKSGNLKQSLDLNEKALAIRQKLGNKKDIASSLSKIANIKTENNEFAEAIELQIQVLKLYDELDIKPYIAQTCNNIGQIYNNLNNFKMSNSYLKRAYEIGKSIDDPYGMSMTLSVWANNYSDMNKLDSAIILYNEAKTIFSEINDLRAYATVCNNLGRIYRKMKNNDKGEEQYREAVNVSKEIGDSAGFAFYQNNLANIIIDRGDFFEAEKLLENSLEIAKKISNQEVELSVIQSMVGLYIQTKNPEKADFYFEKYKSMKDTIFSKETAVRFSEAQTKFEVEKKDLELAKNKLQLESEKNKRLLSYGVILFVVVLLSISVWAFIQKRKNSKVLEEKNKQLNIANAEITHQKEELHEKQTEILDSIRYAKRIQNALLTSKSFLHENLKNHFILFKPKDIVSGDFYWATKYQNCIYFACCDSTGHGVPGAFVSLLNIGFLSEAIKEKGITEPGKIFDYVRMRLIETISDENQKDGFDGILIKIQQGNQTIEYTGANNNPLFIKSGELIHGSTNKMPVGKGIKEDNFQTFSIQLNTNDSIYLFTDGYPDQFGGPKGKKFKYKQLEEMILNNHSLDSNTQQETLDLKLNDWKGNLEQVDDICVIGIKI
jgi:serine phosphatase RsbU (regulator of sigma subunit)